MSLKNQIEEKLNQALKAKDKNTYPTLRLVVSAIKDGEIANRTKENKDMSDSDIMAILKKMIKQRNESCDVYKKAGRNELLDKEMKEIEVISIFLPKGEKKPRPMAEALCRSKSRPAQRAVSSSWYKQLKVQGVVFTNFPQGGTC